MCVQNLEVCREVVNTLGIKELQRNTAEILTLSTSVATQCNTFKQA